MQVWTMGAEGPSDVGARSFQMTGAWRSHVSSSMLSGEEARDLGPANAHAGFSAPARAARRGPVRVLSGQRDGSDEDPVEVGSMHEGVDAVVVGVRAGSRRS